MVHGIFIRLKLGVLIVKEPGQKMTERLAQAFAPKTGTSAWLKRLMPIPAEGSMKNNLKVASRGRVRILHKSHWPFVFFCFLDLKNIKSFLMQNRNLDLTYCLDQLP